MPEQTVSRCLRALAATGAAALLNACGGGGSSAGAPAPESPSSPAASSVPAEPSASAMANAAAAAKKAAATDPLCATSILGDFYWEIGNATSAAPLVSNTEGRGTVTATTSFNIASATKFVFGAYVLQKKGIEQVRANPALHDGLRFVSGYSDMEDTACIGKATVGACNASGNGSAPNPNTVNRFFYNGGHDQKLAAVDLGMASFTSRQIDQEYQAVLGLSPGFSMGTFNPLMAGGLIASAADYAQFLRRVMSQQLIIGAHLGEDAVCAQPASCPNQAIYSPVESLGEPWSYSYNHWVESEKGNGTVDAYSSAGAFGFYPWIAGDRKYYGILSRHDSQLDQQEGMASMRCGRQIRKAFLGALAQTP
ncbi:MAG TPA: hypothetical protein VJ577_17065 [Burkholderiaceae bacterium]|nr:hypothetical protein [Burkholderiaceae bacterium]